MILPSEHYEKNLYPLQDGVLHSVSQLGTNFFLTGGTALSRAYYNHRYSDDLDFFLSQNYNYDNELNKILEQLNKDGFFWDENTDFLRNAYFTTMKVGHNGYNALLKLDFVYDTVPQFGGLQKTDLFYRTDSIRNILSNKLSAIYRYAAKDIADIREIALHESPDWRTAINEARQKEAGLEPVYINEIMKSMPQSEFETIAWIKKPDWEVFCSDIDRIVYEILVG